MCITMIADRKIVVIVLLQIQWQTKVLPGIVGWVEFDVEVQMQDQVLNNIAQTAFMCLL